MQVQTLNLTNHQCRTPASSHHLSEALYSMPHLTDLTLDGGDLREEFYSTWKANASSMKVCVYYCNCMVTVIGRQKDQ